MRKKKIKKTINIFSNQKGMALLTTLIFVFILVTLAVALLTMTNNDSKMSTLQRASNKAFYLADAGIEETFWKLNTPVEDGGEDMLAWRPTDEPDPGTATEYYQITIVDDGVDDDGDAKIKITSTGVVLGGEFSTGKRKIEVTAEIDFIITSKYLYAILADKIILFQGTPGPDITGDVHSNDDILVSGQFDENYDYSKYTATSSGDTNDLDNTPDSSNSGVLPKKDIPTIDYVTLRGLSNSAGNTFIGNKILGNGESWGTEDNPITGIHFIEGNLEAKNGSEIYVKNGAIIATGDVDVKEGALLMIDNDDDYLDPDDYSTALALVAQGNIKIYNSSSVLNGVVQSILSDGKTSEGFIELKNGCKIIGSVIADTVYLRNKSTVTYTSSSNQFTTKGDPFFKKTSWQEVY